MNVWTFSGNLGHTAEQKVTPNGDSIVSFSVAVKSGYGDKASTTWVKCTMWGKRGESVLPYLAKGQLVGVSGEVTMRKYEKKDGGEGTSLELRVNDLTLLGKKGDAAPQDAATPREEEKANAYQKQPNTFDDDVGF